MRCVWVPHGLRGVGCRAGAKEVLGHHPSEGPARNLRADTSSPLQGPLRLDRLWPWRPGLSRPSHSDLRLGSRPALNGQLDTGPGHGDRDCATQVLARPCVLQTWTGVSQLENQGPWAARERVLGSAQVWPGGLVLAPCPGQGPVGLIPPPSRFLLGGGQIAPQSPHPKLLGPLLVQAKPDDHPSRPPSS